MSIATRPHQTPTASASTDTLLGEFLGGVQDGKDAWEKVLAGASLVQLYTAMVYQVTHQCTLSINSYS